MTVPTAWTTGRWLSDVGIIRLASNIGDRTGYFGHWAAPDSYIKNNTLNMLHYPGKFQIGTQQYHSSGFASSVGSEVIKYKHNVISTYGGSSGAPVYLSSLNYGGKTYRNIIVGVHVRGDEGKNGAANEATRLTSSYVTMIKNALKNDGNTARQSSNQLTNLQQSFSHGGATGKFQAEAVGAGTDLAMAGKADAEFFIESFVSADVQLPDAGAHTTLVMAPPAKADVADLMSVKTPLAAADTLATDELVSMPVSQAAAVDTLLAADELVPPEKYQELTVQSDTTNHLRALDDLFADLNLANLV
jgi:hypothetical protein